MSFGADTRPTPRAKSAEGAEKADALGAMPEWELGDLYSGPDSEALAADIEQSRKTVAALKERYQGKLVSLAGDGAALADAILRACPQVWVLDTSRQALGIAGEQVWRVPSLGLPDARRPPPLAEIARSEAVRLFLAELETPNTRLWSRSRDALRKLGQGDGRAGLRKVGRAGLGMIAD